MNRTTYKLLTGVGAFALLFSQTVFADETKLESSLDRQSYAIGINIGFSIKAQDLVIDLDKFIAGVKAGLSENENLLTPEEMQTIFEEIEQKIQSKNLEKQAASATENLKKGIQYLADNKKKEGVKVTKSGLQYKVIKEGTGVKPKATDTVTVHYAGRFINGEEFDSSYARQQAATFTLNQVIKGWSEALQLMTPGSKYLVTIPAEIAYGENAPPAIGPNQVLVFDIELIEVKKTQ